MAIKPMMNFAMQLKHLKGVNKQAFIDKVCNVRKVDALRAAEDLGQFAIDSLHIDRRAQVYEAFTGIDMKRSMQSFHSQNSRSNGKVGYIDDLIDELRDRISRFYSENPVRKSEDDIATKLNERIHRLVGLENEAKSLGIDYSDLDILF